MKKRKLALALAAVMTLGAVAGPAAAVSKQTLGTSGYVELSDAADIQYQDDVSMLIQLGIINGISTEAGVCYQPDHVVTRGALAKMLALAGTLGDPAGITGTASFQDTEEHWAKDYIAYCVDKGIMSGDGVLFRPDEAVSVQALAGCIGALAGADAVQDVDGDPQAEATRDLAAHILASALKDSGAVLYLGASTEPASVTLEEGSVVCAPAGKLVTFVVDGKEHDLTPGTYENASFVLTDLFTTGNMGTWTRIPGYSYRAALYVKEGAVDSSVTSAIQGGVWDAAHADGVAVHAETPGFSAFLLKDSDFTLSNATIRLDSASDGQEVNEFVGYGVAVGAFGDSVLTIEDSTIETAGVAKAATYVDDGADLIVKNSTLITEGGTLFPEYKSNASTRMVTPPWVLGIVGSARTTNVMGEDTTATYVDTTVRAADWGAISIDTGKDMLLTLVNTDVIVEGSGYGAFAYCSGTKEYYYGTRFDVDTYGIILTGADALLTSYTGGSVISIDKLASKAHVADVSSAKVAEGEVVNSVINAKQFGVMFHDSDSDTSWNHLTLEKGTEMNTGNAVFLIKKVNNEIVVDNAKLTSADGVLLQMIDNDDQMIGAFFGEEFGLTFNSTFSEPDGWSSGWKDASGLTEEQEGWVAREYHDSGWVTNATFTNTNLSGNFYNGTGYTSNGGMTLNVALGTGAVLNGAISATEIQHKTKEFTYRYDTYDAAVAEEAASKLGHVDNQAFSNGTNVVNVVLQDGAVWNVTETGIINSLTIGEGCTFNGVQTVNEDGTITVAPVSK